MYFALISLILVYGKNQRSPERTLTRGKAIDKGMTSSNTNAWQSVAENSKRKKSHEEKEKYDNHFLVVHPSIFQRRILPYHTTIHAHSKWHIPQRWPSCTPVTASVFSKQSRAVQAKTASV